MEFTQDATGQVEVPSFEPMSDDDLDIPAFLRRRQ